LLCFPALLTQLCIGVGGINLANLGIQLLLNLALFSPQL